jgi:methyl-accepting chemotaxis protein
MKLSVRISFHIGLLVLGVSIGIGLISTFIAAGIIESNAATSLVHQVESGADLVKTSIQAQLDVLQEVANRSELRNPSSLEAQLASLEADVDRIGYLDLAIVNKDGTAYYVKDKSTSYLGDRDYIIKALSGKQAISDVIISRVLEKPVVMNAVPVRDMNGQVFCALIGRRDGSALNEVTKHVRLGETGYSYMTNKSGVIVSHKETDYVMTQFSPKDAKDDPTVSSWAQAVNKACEAKAGAGGGFLTYTTIEGRKMAVGFIPFDDLPWILYVTIEEEELMAGIKQMILFIMIGALSFMVVGIVSAYFIARSISRPINTLAHILKDISEGEGDLTRTITITERNEIGDLAHYFNLTIEKIKNLLIIIKKETLSLSQTGSVLAANMIETAASIDEITASIRSIRSQTNKQVEISKNTDIIMEQVVDYIETFNEQLKQQTNCISQSSASVESMVANVQNVTQSLVNNEGNVTMLAQASEVGRTGLEEMSADIQEINKKSEGLLEINAVMENIASQTNLLSMNAAIEAAHAGDAGKGFAVVAEEIRKLAESSGEQSKTISNIVTKIKDSIDKISLSTNEALLNFGAINEGVKQVTSQETTVRQAMEEQGAQSKSILEYLDNLDKITGKIKLSAEAMLLGSYDVIVEDETLEQVTLEIENGIKEIASGAEQIDGSVNRVNDISMQNKNQIDTLMVAIAHFKTD